MPDATFLPGDRVDRLVLAGEAVGGAGVDEQVTRGELLRAVGIDESEVAGRRDEVTALRWRRIAPLERPAGLLPRGETAVEHLHVELAEIAQQPPAAGRGEAVRGVVDNDGHIVADAGGAHRVLEPIERRHRMTPARAVVADRVAEGVLELNPAGAGQVCVQVRLVHRGLPERPPHVEQVEAFAGF